MLEYVSRIERKLKSLPLVDIIDSVREYMKNLKRDRIPIMLVVPVVGVFAS